jgi:hypothetical protein
LLEDTGAADELGMEAVGVLEDGVLETGALELALSELLEFPDSDLPSDLPSDLLSEFPLESSDLLGLFPEVWLALESLA